MKIAMLLDTAGRAIRPEDEGTVYVYERRGADWVVARSRAHAPAADFTIAAMRAYLIDLCEWLDVGGLSVSAVGGWHAVIHRDIPRIGNLGIVLSAGCCFWDRPGSGFHYSIPVRRRFGRTG